MTDDREISHHTDPADEELYAALATLSPRPVPAELPSAFRRRLAVARRRRLLRHPLLVAGIAAACVVAIGAGWLHERELRLDDAQRMEGQLAAALQSFSTATRVQAIDAIVRRGERGERGDAVEGALITALLNDPNTNVRIAAAEALGQIAGPATLKTMVRHALATEQSPFVQMTLLNVADRLSIADRHVAINPFLARTGVDPLVASDARERIRDSSRGDSR